MAVVLGRGKGLRVALSNGARIVARTAVSITSATDDGTPGDALVSLSGGASIAGGLKTDAASRLRLALNEAGRFEGRLAGQVDLDVGAQGGAVFVESTRLRSMRLAGDARFARDAAPFANSVCRGAARWRRWRAGSADRCELGGCDDETADRSGPGRRQC
ncbi:MAG: hypothetical protein WDN30_09905 [Pararobbsia sp.]